MRAMNHNIRARFVLCVLGNWSTLDAVQTIAQEFGFRLDREFSQLQPDGRMRNAFQASYDRVEPCMTDEDWARIDNHSAVAYLLSPPIEPEYAVQTATLALQLIAKLFDHGAVAVKCESSGLAHGRVHWIDLADTLAVANSTDEVHSAALALIKAMVRRPLIDEDDDLYYSCGLHLLGQCDVEIDTGVEPLEAVRWIDMLALYILGDRPSRPLAEGEGFYRSVESPRRVIQYQPCRRYESNDFFYNPASYIRLVAE